ncbi:alpha/beta hydrolase [Allokutzneria albata]|uniref:TAP-like protein n=1 Tax=Allokutzneria albata TaxID=211114 RepID=A0A1H0BMK5_ALLAB|nr:alpha/beta hydrolase [Allokutzneria albata]SDN46841.1 TAP-like protein [Allokutzneria albata]
MLRSPTIALLVATLIGSAVPAVATPAANPAPTPIAWGPCPEDALTFVPPEHRFRYSCGTLAVPLDHARPSGSKINLMVLRRAASKPAERIGSVLINPGGPGADGLLLATIPSVLFPSTVPERFDLIGFDPRGVGRSNPLQCFTTQESADALRARMTQVPATDQQIKSTMDAYAEYGRGCGKVGGPIIEHLSTEDTARDMDLLRAALGEQKLTYVGLSYGTLLGATYANLFPGKVRAMLLDGAVDPSLRTNDGLRYDRERALAFEHALTAFLKRCKEEGPKCAFSEGDPRAKFDAIRERLRKGGGPITLSQFVAKVGDALEKIPLSGPVDLAKLATELQQLHTAPEQYVAERTADAPYKDHDAFYGINCSDKPLPRTPSLVPTTATAWERDAPTFGRRQAFHDFVGCAHWPVTAKKVYRGPWNAKTAAPVLVIGIYNDPATSYTFSKRMAAQLGNARLLDVDAFGHTSLGSSTCVDSAAEKYLTNGELPAPGLVCKPNRQPF